MSEPNRNLDATQAVIPPSEREARLIEQARQQAEQHRGQDSLATVPPQTMDVRSPGAGGLTFATPPSGSFPGYEIVREIHRGGQGVVYQAVQKSTRKKVAIKVMREGPFAGPSDRARFEREVQILAQLKHPNIITIHDSGSAAGGFFYVMDYISGQPLDVYVASKKRSVDEVLRLFGKVCDAVNAAHVRGVTHRDLKPGNILVGSDDAPYVLDFGLAKLATVEPANQDTPQPVSITGQFIGSLPWASPEQAEGRPEKIDLRTDVYALGVILYQMLTGRFPYEVVGHIRDVLSNILNAEPARPSTLRRQVNDEVETIVLKCLSKERERRYQSAGELARDIGRYLNREAIEAKRDSFWYVARKHAVRNKKATFVAALVALIVISLGSVSGYFYGGRQEEKRESERRAALAAELHRLNETVRAQAGFGRELVFGWFLLEWSHDRLERANAIRDQVIVLADERAAMDFLLDSACPAEKLVAALPDNLALAHFAIGERQLKAGDAPAALREFELSAVAAHRENWLKAAAQARLAWLREKSKLEQVAGDHHGNAP